MAASIEFFFDFASPYSYIALQSFDALAAKYKRPVHDAAALQAATQDTAIKEKLKAQVGEAIARGVFGAPYIFVDGEPFRGHDRLPQVERWLASGPF